MDDEDPQQAQRAARALLSLDPADEQAARYLMRAHDDRGETGRSLDIYASLWNHLDREYGQEPSLTDTGSRRINKVRKSDKAKATG